MDTLHSSSMLVIMNAGQKDILMWAGSIKNSFSGLNVTFSKVPLGIHKDYAKRTIGSTKAHLFS